MLKAAAIALLSVATASQPATRIVGTEISSEIWYQRGTDSTVATETVLFGDAPFRVAFTIVYRGLKLASTPLTVEVTLLRDAVANPPQASDAVAPAVAVIDGLNVPLLQQTHPTADSIKATLAFEDFEWLVGGKTLEFEAYGRVLVVIPSQLTSLHAAAVEWAHPQTR